MLLLIAASIIAELGERFWLFDLFAHFRWHYLAAVLALALASIVLLSRRCLAGALLIAILQLPALARERELVAPTKDDRSAQLRILNANIHWDNKSPDLLLRLVTDSKPDVLVLQEVRPNVWHAEIERLIRDYPHVLPVDWRRSGTIILSRIELHPQADEITNVADRPAKIVLGAITSGNSRIRIAGYHAFLPLNESGWRSQNEVLARLTREARNGGPIIVAGDFNLTPYSKRFARFLDVSRLRRADLGWLWPHTWPTPSGWFYGGFVFRGFPIDHVLVSPQLAIVRAVRGPDIGSDHYPLIVDLAVAQ